jgi:hypothetical protein
MFTHTTQCMRGVLDPPVSAFSLSLYRHPFLYTLFSSRFTLVINNSLSLYRHPFLYTLFSSRFTLVINNKTCWWECFVLSALEKFVGWVCTLCVLLHIIKSGPLVRRPNVSNGCSTVQKGGGGRGRNVGKRKRISGMSKTIIRDDLRLEYHTDVCLVSSCCRRQM